MNKFEIAGIITGFILFAGNYYMRNRLFNKNFVITPDKEDKVLRHYIATIIGLWLLSISLVLFLIHKNIFPFGFNGLVGGIIGCIVGSFSLVFWAFSESKYKQKFQLTESIGGFFMGCAGLFFHIILGIILGIFFD